MYPKKSELVEKIILFIQKSFVPLIPIGDKVLSNFWLYSSKYFCDAWQIVIWPFLSATSIC